MDNSLDSLNSLDTTSLDSLNNIPLDYTTTAGAGLVSPAMIMGFLAAYFVVIAILYVYYAICFQKIAKKTNTANPWLAWIPIANIYLMCMVAKRPWWWLLLFFIPFVNIVIMIILMMDIAKAVNKPAWMGILMIVPIANLIVPGVLAFSKDTPAATSTPTQQ